MNFSFEGESGGLGPFFLNFLYPSLKRVIVLEGFMKLKGIYFMKNISRIACRAKISLSASRSQKIKA